MRDAYHDAFLTVVQEIYTGQPFLFNDCEKQLIQSFLSLPVATQLLYTRLFLRTRGWKRETGERGYSNYLSRTSEGNSTARLDKIRQGLIEAHLVKRCDSVIDEADNCTGDELVEILKKIGVRVSASSNKLNLVTKVKEMWLHKTLTTASQIKKREKMTEALRSAVGISLCVEQEPAELFERVITAFYFSDEERLDCAILQTMKRRQYANYSISDRLIIFESRQQLIDYEIARKLEIEAEPIMVGSDRSSGFSLFAKIQERVEPLLIAASFAEGHMDMSDSAEVIKTILTDTWIYIRMYLKLARFATSPQEEICALDLFLGQRMFQTRRRGGAYIRKALLLMSPAIKNKQVAYKTCIDGLHDPSTTEVDKVDLHKRLKKLEKALNIPHKEKLLIVPLKSHVDVTIFIQSANERRKIFKTVGSGGASIMGKSLWKHEDTENPNDTVSVEKAALLNYNQQSWKGEHCEGRIFRTIFALLFWDIIFLDIPGAFQHKYQSWPLDRFEFKPRETHILQRLSKLKESTIQEILHDIAIRYSAEYGNSCSGVSWNYSNTTLLQIVECIGKNVICMTCELFARNYRVYASGMPDLFLWNPEKKTAMCVEVKSENDVLSDKQILWIHHFLLAGMPVEVCHVLDSGKYNEKTGQKRKRK